MWIRLFSTTKICIGPLTTEIFKVVKLYGSPCMYDEWKTGRRERKSVRERLGRKGGIVFQSKDIHNKRGEKSV